MHGKTQINRQMVDDNQFFDKKNDQSDWQAVITERDVAKTHKQVEEFAKKLWIHMEKSSKFPYPFGWIKSSKEQPT